MIRRLLALRFLVPGALARLRATQHKKTCPRDLTDQDWRSLEALEQVLQPFYSSTTVMSHQHSTVSQVLPTLHGLYWESQLQIAREDEVWTQAEYDSEMDEVEIPIEELGLVEDEGEEDDKEETEDNAAARSRQGASGTQKVAIQQENNS
jgi:hypothetical protein